MASLASIQLMLSASTTSTFTETVGATATLIGSDQQIYQGFTGSVFLSDTSNSYSMTDNMDGTYSYIISNPGGGTKSYTATADGTNTVSDPPLSIQWAGVPAFTDFLLTASSLTPLNVEGVTLTAVPRDQYGEPFALDNTATVTLVCGPWTEIDGTPMTANDTYNSYTRFLSDPGQNYNSTNPNTSTLYVQTASASFTGESSPISIVWPSLESILLAASDVNPVYDGGVTFTAVMFDQNGGTYSNPSEVLNLQSLIGGNNAQDSLTYDQNTELFTYFTTQPAASYTQGGGTYTATNPALTSNEVYVDWLTTPVATSMELSASSLSPLPQEGTTFTATVFDQRGATFTGPGTVNIDDALSGQGNTYDMARDANSGLFTYYLQQPAYYETVQGATYQVGTNSYSLTASPVYVNWPLSQSQSDVYTYLEVSADPYPVYGSIAVITAFGKDQSGATIAIPPGSTIFVFDTAGGHTYTCQEAVGLGGAASSFTADVLPTDYPAGTTVTFKASDETNGVTFQGLGAQIYWPLPGSTASLDLALTQYSLGGLNPTAPNNFTIMHDAGPVGISVLLYGVDGDAYVTPTSDLELVYGADTYDLTRVTDNSYTTTLGNLPIHDFGVQGVSYGTEDMYLRDRVTGNTGGVCSLQYNGFFFENSYIHSGIAKSAGAVNYTITSNPVMNWQVGLTLPEFTLTAFDYVDDIFTGDLTDKLFLGGVTLVLQNSNIYAQETGLTLNVDGVSGFGMIDYNVICNIPGATGSYPWHLFHYDFDNTNATFRGPSGSTLTRGTGAVIAYNPGVSVINNGQPFTATMNWTTQSDGVQPSAMAGGGVDPNTYSQVATWSALQQSGLSFSVDSFLTPGTHTFTINLSFGVGGLTGTIPGIPLSSQAYTLTYEEPTFQFFVNGSTATTISRSVPQPVSLNVNYYDSTPALWTYPDPLLSVLNNQNVEYPLVPTPGQTGNFRAVSGVTFNTSIAPKFEIVPRGTTAGIDSFLMTYTDVQIPCFFAEAPVLTPSGNKRIDSLKTGDVIVTPKGFAFVKNLRSYTIAASEVTNPFIIPQGTLGASEDLLISPNHAVCVDGKMVVARKLGLEQTKFTGKLNYFNLELDKWENMYVAGVEVESLAPAAWVVIIEALEKAK
jgi:hypothetical protein